MRDMPLVEVKGRQSSNLTAICYTDDPLPGLTVMVMYYDIVRTHITWLTNVASNT